MSKHKIHRLFILVILAIIISEKTTVIYGGQIPLTMIGADNSCQKPAGLEHPPRLFRCAPRGELREP
jgi:hypothetical protein